MTFAETTITKKKKQKTKRQTFWKTDRQTDRTTYILVVATALGKYLYWHPDIVQLLELLKTVILTTLTGMSCQ